MCWSQTTWASASQPAAVGMALGSQDTADAAGDARYWRLAACDLPGSVAPAEGGAAFVEATVSEGPHAPWWVPEEGHPASLIQTGLLAGVLHARAVRHPWLDKATRRHVGRRSSSFLMPRRVLRRARRVPLP